MSLVYYGLIFISLERAQMTQNTRYVIVVGFSQGLKQVLCFPGVQELLNVSSLQGFF